MKTCRITVLAILALLPVWAFAAEIRIDSRSQEINLGERFSAAVVLSAEEGVNAIEGTIVFPTNVVEAKEVHDGSSLISFWIEKPKIGDGTIFFSGIVPGGFHGKDAVVLSVLFQATGSGDGAIAIQDANVLKNDGAGTPTDVRTFDFQFTVSGKSSAVVSPKEKDYELPESFQPELTRDTSLFGGKWFLVFATQDKSSGIDHYEVKESRQRFFSLWGKWFIAESPYVLQDQELRSYVFIKAIDKDGNQRVMTIAPRNPLIWYENDENWVIIVTGALTTLLAAFFVFRFRPKVVI